MNTFFEVVAPLSSGSTTLLLHSSPCISPPCSSLPARPLLLVSFGPSSDFFRSAVPLPARCCFRLNLDGHPFSLTPSFQSTSLATAPTVSLVCALMEQPAPPGVAPPSPADAPRMRPTSSAAASRPAEEPEAPAGGLPTALGLALPVLVRDRPSKFRQKGKRETSQTAKLFLLTTIHPQVPMLLHHRQRMGRLRPPKVADRRRLPGCRRQRRPARR